MKTILLILLTLSVNAQSLISNGSFEQFDSIPDGSGDIKLAHGWKSWGSADYFHQYATVMSGVNIPYNFIGTMQAYEGQACAGICCYMDGWVNYREYLSYKFDKAMEAGYMYDISLYVLNNPSFLQYGGISSDNFGIALSMVKINNPIGYNVQNIQSGQLYGYGWKKVQFSYFADSAYKFITIGVFVSDSVQVRQVVDTTALIPCVYYMIDNIVVSKVVPLGMEEHVVDAVKKKLNYNLLGQKIK